jgi:type VI protein secretion system component VasF
MRQEYKKRNSPRMQSAINRMLNHVYSVLTLAYNGRYRIVYNPYTSGYLGVSILMLAYGADKYDVLNRLCTGKRNKIVTFARGDIRHRYWRMKYLLLLVLALTVLLTMLEEVIFLNVTRMTR